MRDDAHQRADPALAKARQRELVQAEAQDRDADEDRAGRSASSGRRLGGRRRAAAVAAPGEAVAASSRPRGSPWRARCRSGRSRAPARRRRGAPGRPRTSQRRFSISQLTSVAKAASPSTRELRPLADDELRERQRRIGGVDRHAQIGRQSRGRLDPFDQARRGDAKGDRRRRRQQRRPAFELDAQGSRGVRTQPFHRLRLGGNHVVEEQHDPLHHRPFRERLHRLEHASIVGGTPVNEAGAESPARLLEPRRCRTIATMQAIPTAIDGVIVFEPKVFGDARGFLPRDLSPAGRSMPRSAAMSSSSRTTIRARRAGCCAACTGRKRRMRRASWCACRRGAVFDVAVDIRRGSPTFGRWFGTELSDANQRQLWIAPGLAHGFLVLSEAPTSSTRRRPTTRPQPSARSAGTTPT